MRPADAGLVLSRRGNRSPTPTLKTCPYPVSAWAYGGEMANAQRLDDSGTAFAPRAS